MLNSILSDAEEKQAVSSVASGESRYLFVTPEQPTNDDFVRLLTHRQFVPAFFDEPFYRDTFHPLELWSRLLSDLVNARNLPVGLFEMGFESRLDV